MAALSLELRPTGPAFEEVLERRPQVLDGQLRGTLGDLQHPRERLSFHPVELLAKIAFGHLFPQPVKPFPLRQSPVVCETRHSASLREVGSLYVVGVHLYPMSQNHNRRYLRHRKNLKSVQNVT